MRRRWTTKTDRERYEPGRVLAAVLNKLRAAEGGWVTTTALIEHVYDGDEPELPDRCIHLTVMHLRKKGFPIVSMRGHASRGYRFEPLCPKHARVWDLIAAPSKDRRPFSVDKVLRQPQAVL